MEHRPREEWLAVPVDITGASVERAVIERAREVARDRYKKPSRAAGRFWQLRGIARCAECGSVLSPHTTTRRRKDGSRAANPYYECRRKWNNGSRDCDHTRSYPAAWLEELIWNALYGLLSDPERLRRQHRAHVERKRVELRGDPDREATALAERLQKLERRRSGYIDLAADGDMSREELRGKLAGLEAQGRQQSIEELERQWHIYAQLVEHFDRITYVTASDADRSRLYQALRLRADVDAEGTIRLSGIFDPDVYLPGVLQDGPRDPSEPVPKVPAEPGTSVVVALTSTP